MCNVLYVLYFIIFFFKQKTAYEMRISDWSSDVCSSDLVKHRHDRQHHAAVRHVEHVWLDLGDRVDDVRAMLVEHTLRIASRPAGIAKPDRIAFVEGHPFEIAVLGVDQVAIGKIAHARRCVEKRSERHKSEIQSLMLS